MPSAHWHPGATLGAVSATWTLQERETGKRKADNAPPGILLMWVLRAPPESGLGSRQDVFNEPQRISTVASQQPSSLLRTTRSGQRDGKPGGEFIKSRKRCLRNHKSNGWHDLRKLLWLSDSVVKSSSEERFSPLSQPLVLTFFHFLSSFIWPWLPMPSDPTRHVHRVALLPCPTAGPVHVAATEKNSSHHYRDICKLRWWFSNCEFWYATYCFTYSKLLFQTLPGANTSK